MGHGVLHSNRQYDNTFNIFEGVLRNWLFMSVSAIMVGTQILIVLVGSAAFSIRRLTGQQWAISLVLGFLTLPLGVLMRLVPDGPCEKTIAFVSRPAKLFQRQREPSIELSES